MPLPTQDQLQRLAQALISEFVPTIPHIYKNPEPQMPDLGNPDVRVIPGPYGRLIVIGGKVFKIGGKAWDVFSGSADGRLGRLLVYTTEEIADAFDIPLEEARQLKEEVQRRFGQQPAAPPKKATPAPTQPPVVAPPAVPSPGAPPGTIPGLPGTVPPGKGSTQPGRVKPYRDSAIRNGERARKGNLPLIHDVADP